MTGVDYAALPPEVNSARMYAGAGAGPLAVAAAAWDKLAAELNSAASSYRAIVSELTDGAWRGPAAAAMTAAITPYLEWMGTTGTQAAHTANQARAAATAYEAAFAATVPPPVVAANRAARATLVAHNTFGQNTPAIAANDAQYMELWTQDATAMNGYAAHATAATTLTPFRPAPQDTNPAASATQSGAAPIAQSGPVFNPNAGVLGNLLGLPLQTLNSPLITQIDNLNGIVGLPLTLMTGPEYAAVGAEVLVGPVMAAMLSFPPYSAGLSGAHSGGGDMPRSVLATSGSTPASPGAGISAGMGRAAPIGGLSAPQSWGAAAPEVRLAGTALPAAGAAGLPAAGIGGTAGPAGLAGAPMVLGSIVNTPKNAGAGPGVGLPAAAGAGQPGGRGGAPGVDGASSMASALTEREREEFNRLREEVAEMVMECEATTRLMGEALKQ